MGYGDKYDQYNKLNDAEKSYLWWNPWYIDDVQSAGKKALSKAQDLYGRGSLHNGAGDAFRHCYWNALMAKTMGKDEALEFSTAHEENPNNPAEEKEMDLFNNAVGADIGEKYKNSSDEELANLCQAAEQGGQLMIIKP